MHEQRHEERVTGCAALATVILMLPAIVVSAAYPIPIGGEPGDLVAYLALHRASILATLYLSALGWGGTLLVFAGGLRTVLRRAEGGSALWSHIAFGACLVTAAAILAVLVPIAAVAYRAPNIDAGIASVLGDATNVANLFTAFPNAVYTFAAAVVIRRTSVLPRAIAVLAAAVAAIHLLSAASFARAGAFAPSGVLPTLAPLSHTIWLAAVAFVLLRGRRP